MKGTMSNSQVEAIQVADAHTSNAALPTYSAVLALAQRRAYPDAGDLLILEDYRNILRNLVQPDGMKIEATKEAR